MMIIKPSQRLRMSLFNDIVVMTAIITSAVMTHSRDKDIIQFLDWKFNSLSFQQAKHEVDCFASNGTWTKRSYSVYSNPVYCNDNPYSEMKCENSSRSESMMYEWISHSPVCELPTYKYSSLGNYRLQSDC